MLSLMLRALLISNTYQFYNLWFDLTWTRIPDLQTLKASTPTITPLMWFISLEAAILVSVCWRKI
jgi:hypothetical protein